MPRSLKAATFILSLAILLGACSSDNDRHSDIALLLAGSGGSHEPTPPAWHDPILLEDTDNVASKPDVAMNAGGRAVAVWNQSDGNADSIYASHYY